MIKSFTTQAIAEALDGELVGDGTLLIERVTHPTDVTSPNDLALAVDNQLLPLLIKTRAKAAVISRGAKLDPDTVDTYIVVSRPRLAMAKLTGLFATPVLANAGIHPTAIVEKGVILGKNVSIGAYVYIAEHAKIGDNSILHPQVYIGPNASIGSDALIYPGVRIGSRVQIGDRTIIHFNASVGSDGFSFVTPETGNAEAAKATGTVSSTKQTQVRIASLGTVIIGHDVEIGANSTIDRGTIAATRIGNGTKIDNQVQIGHNVLVGDDCLICGNAGIAGSTSVGNRVVLGGASAIADHLKIGDDAVVMGMSGVAGNVLPHTVVGGYPATTRDKLVENHFYFGRIKGYMKKIEDFTKRLDRLEQTPKTD